jgi:hypothetical protein
MDRGRGSADQRNQATISHELQKYSRSRTGKGMNSREVAGRLDPCRGDRDVAGGQRAGAEAAVAMNWRRGDREWGRELTVTGAGSTSQPGGKLEFGERRNSTGGWRSDEQGQCSSPASRDGCSSPVAGGRRAALAESPRRDAARCGQRGRRDAGVSDDGARPVRWATGICGCYWARPYP